MSAGVGGAGLSTAVAPTASGNVNELPRPYAKNNLATDRQRSSSVICSVVVAYVSTVAFTLPCRCMTPLGVPVVPDEYSQNDGVAPVVSATAAGSTGSPSPSDHGDQRTVASSSILLFVVPLTMTDSMVGAAALIASTVSRNVSEMTRARAPESAMISASECPFSIVESGTGTSPERWPPRKNAGKVSSSCTTIATRSPASRPSAARRCWTRQMSRCSSA